MADGDHYLAVFTSDKNGPRWGAWYAMTDEERRRTDEVGLAALAAWDEAHRDVIVYPGGPARADQAHHGRGRNGRGEPADGVRGRARAVA